MQLANTLATISQWLGRSSGLIRGMNDVGAASDLLNPYDAAISGLILVCIGVVIWRFAHAQLDNRQVAKQAAS
jgi:ammonia channel protein AmtB